MFDDMDETDRRVAQLRQPCCQLQSGISVSTEIGWNHDSLDHHVPELVQGEMDANTVQGKHRLQVRRPGMLSRTDRRTGCGAAE
jgi:hypothetical protein